MTSGDRAAYRALPRRERRAVRRAARRGRRSQVDAALAEPLLGFAARRQARARRVLVLAVLMIVGSAGAAAWLYLRSGPGPLLVAPAAGLLLGGLAGVGSEAGLRRAEEAESRAAQELRRAAERRGAAAAGDAAGGGAAAGGAAATTGGGTATAGPQRAPDRQGHADASPAVAPVDGDAARRRLARILAGTQVVRPRSEGSSSHPWD